ncbi:MAG: TonB-dependent siderophore receptor [Novosphingobium sp.]
MIKSKGTARASSIIAAMLIAAPNAALAADENAAEKATAADTTEADAAAAEAADYAPDGSAILVIGRGEEVDLATIRGPVIDVPQTINVISGEVLEDRRVTTLSEALRNVAGVTTTVGEGGVVNGDQFFIRGQAARDDVFTDGLRDFGAFTRDAFNYESIQVLKGSSSTALGRGVSGGAINTQSKRAKSENLYDATIGVGTDDYVRGTIDLNQGIGSSAGVRLNAMFHRNDVPDRDRVESERWGVAGAFNYGAGMDTSVDVFFFHQEEDNTVDYGVPIAVTTLTTDIERPVTEFGVPRSNFYGFDGDENDTTVNTLTVRFGHRANDWLSFTSDTKGGVYKRSFRQTVPSCAAACGDALLDTNPATVPMVSSGVRGEFRQTTRGIQNVSTALIEAPLGGLRNELIIGWDVSYQTNDREDDIRPNNGAVSSVSQSLFAPAAASPLFSPTQVFQFRDTSATDYSFFFDERLWVLPNLSLNAGLRYQHFTSDQEQIALRTNANGPVTSCNGVTGTFTTCLSRSEVSFDLWNPKASIIFEPSDNTSFYATYSRASVPPGNSVSNGSLATPLAGAAITANDLSPEKTETFDIGAKFSVFGDRLLIQTAIYQINRKNARDIDPTTQLLVASGDPKQRLRGFEFGASGTITPDILVTANYAFVDAEIREAVASGVIDLASIGKQVRYVPRHSASLWTAYKPLEGNLKGLEVGLGANYQSKVYLNNQNTQVAPSFFVVDALLGYNFGRFNVSLNGYNLTDKLYYAQVNGGRVVPAAGRSAVLTLGARF